MPNPQVKNLANLMRMKKQAGETFVLLLGAGASMSSGVVRTQQLMEELLQKFGQDLSGTDRLEDRFDALWRRTSDANRRAFLQPYLDRTPSSGYSKLAALIGAGFFEVALTFNFDDLVEKSLASIGFTNYKRIIRGETIEDEMQKLVDAREPSFKLVKLHGSLKSADHFLFDVNEMNEYPAAIGSLVSRITSGDIITCGYAFKDLCVIRAFAQRGGSVVCVDPVGVPRELRGFLRDRRSDDLSIAAFFDDFFDELHHELLSPPDAVPPEPVPPNPFKFLESYEESDQDAFEGRDEEIADFLHALAKSPAPRIIIVAGPAKSGKTSLVRAGVLPQLDADKYHGVYVRVRREIEKSLPHDLCPGGTSPDDMTLQAALQHVGDEWAPRRVVLFLDQFDRATRDFDLSTRDGRHGLTAFVSNQLMAGPDSLTLVLVVVDDSALVQTLVQACNQRGVAFSIVQCAVFERKDVAAIIQALAAKGGFKFDDRIIDELLQNYEQSKNSSTPDKRFTLAHIQAVCHILAATRPVAYETYRTAFDKNLDALHQAINVCDIIAFVEDFPWSDAVWFRNMIKVPLRESRERIADFIKLHYEELVPKPGAKGGRGLFAAPGSGRLT
jgi:hypothetical protein